MKPISAQSKTWVKVAVWAKEAGLVVNPTLNTTVEMAFALAKTDPLVWKTASWEIDAVSEPDIYWARCLVGPGGGTVTLAAGQKYWVAIRISGTGVNPELPVIWSNLRLEVEP